MFIKSKSGIRLIPAENLMLNLEIDSIDDKPVYRIMGTRPNGEEFTLGLYEKKERQIEVFEKLVKWYEEWDYCKYITNYADQNGIVPIFKMPE